MDKLKPPQSVTPKNIFINQITFNTNASTTALRPLELDKRVKIKKRSVSKKKLLRPPSSTLKRKKSKSKKKGLKKGLLR